MRLLRFAPALCFLSATLACGAQQTPARQPPTSQTKIRQAELKNALTHLNSGKFNSIDVAIIMGAHDLEAIPELETQFTRSTDPDMKESLADALIRLGQNHGPYWDYMIGRANQALKDPPPTVFAFDANGKTLPRFPPQLIRWAAQHHMTTKQAAKISAFDDPLLILGLALSQDPRTLPILRRALNTNNVLITASAAKGLAALHDNASIPVIIRDCQSTPKEAAVAIAQSLIYFDDPRAQHAADLYLPKAQAAELRTYRAEGHTPFQ